MADCTEEIFVKLFEGWKDKAVDIETIFELRLAQKVVGNVLTVLHHASRSLLDEVRIIGHLSTAVMWLGTQGWAMKVFIDLRKLMNSISPPNLNFIDHY